MFSRGKDTFSWKKSLLGKMGVLCAGLACVYWTGWPQETIPTHSFSAPREHVRPGMVTHSGPTIITPLPAQSRVLPVLPAVQSPHTVAFNTLSRKVMDSSTRIDLNDATVAQLESLPGIGRVLAERIVTHRSSQGAFRRIEELERIPGIGEKRLRQLRPLVGLRGTISQ